MIKIQPEKEKYYNAIHGINVLAFGRENEARLVENLRKSRDFIPELSLVTLNERDVVGHILFSPIAIKTKEGLPLVQAEPVETAIPCKLNVIRTPSPSMPRKEKFALVGNLFRRSPLSWLLGISASTLEVKWSRKLVKRAFSSNRLDSTLLRALAKPTMPTTFSVPARRLPSCSPPRILGSSGVPRRRYKMPVPFGP